MKVLKKIGYFIAPIIVGWLFIIGLNKFLDSQINKLMESKDLSIIKNQAGSIYKDKGVIFNEYANRGDDIFLQGSSELSSPVEQLPTEFFPIEGFNKDITAVGKANVQTLEHSAILGSQNIDMSKSNVTLILSLQWFMEQNGIGNTNFQATFSPVQFYKYLDNDKISKENKVKYASRVSKLLEGSSQYSQEMTYAKIYSEESFLYKLAGVIFEPYFWTRKEIVELKDKGLLYKELKKSPEKAEIEKKEVDWDKEYVKAGEQGKSQVTNNNFMVYDSYYDKYLKANIDSTKDSKKEVNLLDSIEYTDYELYLDTCVELGIKPYIVLMPTNGLWYDHLGITKDERQSFYSNVEKMALNKGFEVLNLSDKEYSSYFMCDVMHLGWEGWLRVNEEIYKHFK